MFSLNIPCNCFTGQGTKLISSRVAIKGGSVDNERHSWIILFGMLSLALDLRATLFNVRQIRSREWATFQMRALRLHVVRQVGHEAPHLGHPREVQAVLLRIVRLQDILQGVPRPSPGNWTSCVGTFFQPAALLHSSIGREFFKVAPVPFVSPVPFLIIAPGPVHFPVPFVLISPGAVHFPVLLAKFGNKWRTFGNLINSMHHN